MESKRCIVHINIIGFAHAVAALSDPSLQNRPVVVATKASRSQILDLSPHAYSFGIRKGMPLSYALHLCPDCRITPPNFNMYRKAMLAMRKEINLFSPLIEHGVSDGHMFADLSGTSRLFGSGVDVARRICKSVTTRIGLSPGWAIASNKLVAKVASRASRCHGECEVSLGQEALFLAPHDLAILPGVQKKEIQYLDEFCLNRIGETVNLSMAQLHVLLDKRAPFYHDACRGIDTLPVGQHVHQQVITSFFAFPEDTNKEQRIRAVTTLLGAHLSFNLRQQNVVISQVIFKLEYTDTTTVTRKITLPNRTNHDLIITKYVQASLTKLLRKRLRIRSLHLKAGQLKQAGQQLSLFASANHSVHRAKNLMQALDTIATRYTPDMVMRARSLPIKT